MAVKSCPTIVVVGSLNYDVCLTCERRPQSDETVTASRCTKEPGGKGGNQAVACARLGARVKFAARIGRDLEGTILRDSIKKAGVEDPRIFLDPEQPTGLAVVISLGADGNEIIVFPGANQAWTSDEIDATIDLLSDADVMLAQCEVPVSVLEAVARAGRGRALACVLDTAPAPHHARELLRLYRVISPNSAETEVLTGVRVDCRETARQAVAALRALGASDVVLKLWERGCFVAPSDEEGVWLDVVPVSSLDPIGAGDAFMAGLAVEIGKGAELTKAARFASACGAAATLRLGTQRAMPTREQVAEVLALSK